MLNYTTNKLKEEIESKENRRKTAVYFAGRIKKSNRSPGFDWEKAIEGFRLKFKAETIGAINSIGEEQQEAIEEPIEWIDLIIYFSNEPYKKD